MDVEFPKPDRYVLAVSGGVDSVALLHLLHDKDSYELVVAHFDHGVRDDSEQDRQLVQELARKFELEFVYEEGKLGAGASENKARQARYRFLRQVMKEQAAKAIITAHHQDDLLETAIINMLRGTGRKGLTALKNQPDLLRPLLKVTKAELINYAKTHKLKWREDTTNTDESYLRNYVRQQLISKFDAKAKSNLLLIIEQLTITNQTLDALLVKELANHSVNGQIDRQWFNNLPHEVAREVMASWLRSQELRGFDRPTLERLVVAAKTAKHGKSFPIYGDHYLRVAKNNLAVHSIINRHG